MPGACVAWLLASSAACASSFTQLYSFAGQTDGGYPKTSVVIYNGLLYGTTAVGGGSDSNGSTRFGFDPVSKLKTILHVFGGASDGGVPGGQLIMHDGILYGGTAGTGLGQTAAFE